MILSRLRETYWHTFHTLPQRLVLLSSALLFTGFVCSRALASIGIIGYAVAALWHIKDFKFLVIAKRKELPLITLLFFGVLVSGLWSSDTAFWLNFTRIHLAYLILPIAFLLLPPITKQQFSAIAMLFVTIMIISGIAVLGNYILHFKAINKSMTMGGVIPMPYSHIRYTLMLVFAFCIAIYYALAGIDIKRLLWGGALFLFVLIHVLSVRSGLFVLYLSIGLIFVMWLWRSRNWKLGIGIASLVIVLAAIAFTTIPSLKNKIDYMRYDMFAYKNDMTIDASDGMRFRSWQVAVEVSKELPWYGAGYGDLQLVMNEYYDAHFPTLMESQKKLPHNQWLWWLVSNGWIGVVVFSLAVFYPFIKYFNTPFWLWHCFFVIIIGSFIWEATLEEQMGTGFFSVWLMLMLQLMYKGDSHE